MTDINNNTNSTHNTNTQSNANPPLSFAAVWQAIKDAIHVYAKWLVSLSWKLFAAISLLVLIAGSMLYFPDLAFLVILTSIVIKASFKQQIEAEQKASAATFMAEAEQLKRQLVEARMAAMQAQVEPHFLFNTLASIDHLIETDPARASLMQKSLIALLRATLPAMRETTANTVAYLAQNWPSSGLTWTFKKCAWKTAWTCSGTFPQV